MKELIELTRKASDEMFDRVYALRARVGDWRLPPSALSSQFKATRRHPSLAADRVQLVIEEAKHNAIAEPLGWGSAALVRNKWERDALDDEVVAGLIWLMRLEASANERERR